MLLVYLQRKDILYFEDIMFNTCIYMSVYYIFYVGYIYTHTYIYIYIHIYTHIYAWGKSRFIVVCVKNTLIVNNNRKVNLVFHILTSAGS